MSDMCGYSVVLPHAVVDAYPMEQAIFDERRPGVRSELSIHCGPKTTKRIVPPAGEEYAFDSTRWTHSVHISVSPTGRRTSVWVDGKRVL